MIIKYVLALSLFAVPSTMIAMEKLTTTQQENMRQELGPDYVPTSVERSADGKIVTGDDASELIRIWDTEGKLLSVVSHHSSTITSVKVLPNGNVVVTSQEATRVYDQDGTLVSE